MVFRALIIIDDHIRWCGSGAVCRGAVQDFTREGLAQQEFGGVLDRDRMPELGVTEKVCRALRTRRFGAG